MQRLGNGRFRYIAWRLAGFVATIVVTALLLALFLGGPQTFPALWRTLTFDFGENGARIAERLLVTLPLALMALLFALVIGFVVGSYAALKRSRVAVGTAVALQVFVATPPFWLGMILLVVVGGMLRLAPSGGFMPWQQNAGGAFASLLLPVLALALPLAGPIAARVRSLLANLDHSPVVVAARLHGRTFREAVWRHGMAPALLPLVPELFRRAALVIPMAMVVENVFYLPGLGRLLFDAVAVHDGELVHQTLFVLITLCAAIRLIGAFVVAGIDPRTGTEANA
jgi:peptide/nickel transport system permease protein